MKPTRTAQKLHSKYQEYHFGSFLGLRKRTLQQKQEFLRRLARVKIENVLKKSRVEASSTPVMTAIHFLDSDGTHINCHRSQTGMTKRVRSIAVVIKFIMRRILSLLYGKILVLFRSSSYLWFLYLGFSEVNLILKLLETCLRAG
jgi:hypothetical protein